MLQASRRTSKIIFTVFDSNLEDLLFSECRSIEAFLNWTQLPFKEFKTDWMERCNFHLIDITTSLLQNHHKLSQITLRLTLFFWDKNIIFCNIWNLWIIIVSGFNFVVLKFHTYGLGYDYLSWWFHFSGFWISKINMIFYTWNMNLPFVFVANSSHLCLSINK